jgi:predicted metalloprotease with PDZ domain
MNSKLSRIIFLVNIIAALSGCCKTPVIDTVRYEVTWSKEHPFEMQVIMTLPDYPSGDLPIQRAKIPGKDHNRGFVEILSPHRKSAGKDHWIIPFQLGQEIPYLHSFLLSEDPLGGSFRNSRSEPNHIFIQSVDLFCLPQGIHADTQFEVKMNLPDEYEIFTTWIRRGDIYRIDYEDLTSAFIVAGKFRTQTVTSGKSKVLLVIDINRPKREDKLIADSLGKSLSSLQRQIPIGTPGRFTFVVENIKGNISRAMRRGDFVLLGISDVLPFGQKERKQISHELFHLKTETVHNASWFEESASEYYALITLVQTKQIRQQAFFQAVTEKITQAQYSPYKGSLRSAVAGKGGENGRNYVYSLGMLGMFALDIELHAAGVSRGLSEFLTHLHSKPENIPATEAILRRNLKRYSNSNALQIMEAFADGKVAVSDALTKAGLSLKTSGYTLLDVVQESTGDFGRILPGDTIISIDYQHLEKSKWRQYLKNHVNQIVTVQIERNGSRIEQKHRIIPKYVIEPLDYSLDATWQEILRG